MLGEEDDLEYTLDAILPVPDAPGVPSYLLGKQGWLFKVEAWEKVLRTGHEMMEERRGRLRLEQERERIEKASRVAEELAIKAATMITVSSEPTPMLRFLDLTHRFPSGRHSNSSR